MHEEREPTLMGSFLGENKPLQRSLICRIEEGNKQFVKDKRILFTDCVDDGGVTFDCQGAFFAFFSYPKHDGLVTSTVIFDFHFIVRIA